MKRNKNLLILCYALLFSLLFAVILMIVGFNSLDRIGETSMTFIKQCLTFATLFIAIGYALVITLQDYLSDIIASAYRDVTGIHNKKSLEKKIQQLQEKHDTLNVGMMMFDLNNLKYINDTYGHEKGDIFIQSFASYLTRILTTDSFLARFGGDEFVIIQENTTLKQLEDMNNRLQSLIDEHNTCTDVPISYAAGFDASYKNHYFLIEDLMKEADKKMYQDKAFKKRLSIFPGQNVILPIKGIPTLSVDILASKIYSVLVNSSDDKKYALIMTDINNFHFINDTFGYQTGNQILNILSEKMAEIPGVVFSCHFHSDIFVTMADITSMDLDKFEGSIKKCNENTSLTVAELYPISYFNLSTGIYFIADKYQLPENIISYTNTARRKAKSNNTCQCVYTDEMAKFEKIQGEILHSFYSALKAEDFQIYFQPKLSGNDLKITSAEVIVRWMKNGEVQWSPDIFVPMLEQTGGITELDFYVYEKAFQWINSKKIRGEKIIPLSLNVSPVHLKQPEDFLTRLLSLINQYKIDTSYIIFEITENTFINNLETVNEVIESLHSQNIRISMDDFGSGYSSLNSLKNILFDEVKIDKQFLSNDLSGNGKIVLQELFHMLKRMKKSIVCEGVEDDEISHFLINEGCDELQGFLYYKPMCQDDFSRLPATAFR